MRFMSVGAAVHDAADWKGVLALILASVMIIAGFGCVVRCWLTEQEVHVWKLSAIRFCSVFMFWLAV